ncbi:MULTISPECIES: hypothetical protein [Paraburkholderia]|uniref:Uncharacterized protein n=1 Tax=Paraburkholderia madseniana TaxID=2599607 RepID=A0AAP5ENA2_9BURK|nr:MULTISPECIES: hypothetical protein [Paraburkholderia]MCX4146887.1 hypothetical protein [Paraburkholderia madseniana]MDN7149833.1 hypothetical protein [Paraburkholderia sp. WS6]MDQ6408713.1 hypothetical protein [Paraburkholderia madseniana]
MNTFAGENKPQRTFHNMAVRVIAILESHFVNTIPEKTVESFEAEILIPMLEDDSISGEGLYNEIKTQSASQPIGDPEYAAMLVACAYYAQSLKASRDNDLGLAWSYMSDACYWAGVIQPIQTIYKLREDTIQATRINGASNAGKASAKKKYEASIDVAYRLAREMRPKEKGWKSRLHAAKTIKDKVRAFSIENKDSTTPLSEHEVLNTVYGWLDNMPDAAELFPKKPKKSS